MTDLTQQPPRAGDPNLVAAELYHVIEQAVLNTPRTLQTAIGPSELGVPCTRRLAHKLAGTPECNDRGLPWKATMGTAGHLWLEGVFERENARLVAAGEAPRYLIEHRLCVGDIGPEPCYGHTDIYDMLCAAAVDWKFPGPTRLAKYRKHGPGRQYRVQAHLYGRGWVALGYPVDTVHVIFLPRNGEWKERVHWWEPFDEQVALEALKRAEGVQTALGLLGDQAFAQLPTDPDDCAYCPWFSPGTTDLARRCPGDPERTTSSHSSKPVADLSGAVL